MASSAVGFPDDYSPDLPERWADYFRWAKADEIARLAQQYPDRTALTLDWTRIARWAPELAEDVLGNPKQMTEYAEEGLHTMPLPVDLTLGQVTIRFENLPPHYTTSPGDYSPSKRRGQLLAFEGQVAKRTQVGPRIKEAAFECRRCGTMTYIPQRPGGWIQPAECQGCECAGPFRLNYDQSVVEDFQKVLLENPESAATGGDTADIEVFLTGGLPGHSAVENCQRVSITGRLGFVGDGPHPDERVYANNIEGQDADYRDVDLSAYEPLFDRLRDDPESFDVTATDPSTLDVLIEAAAPKFVAGNHRRDQQVVKAIVLQLVGGATFDSRSGAHYRGDLHVLLPGDPGVGKSVIAKWAAEVAPKSAFASGERTSGPGLTAAAVKDDFSDDGFSIQPGVVVRAHRGVAVVDEFEKAGEEAISKMHSALADQIVPVNLAGQEKTLPAECGLLAVANPSSGHFTPGGGTLGEQLPLSSPLLSRFDLILQMRSKEDRDRVRELSESMLRTWEVALRDERGEQLSEADRQEVEGLISADEFKAVIMKAKRLLPTPASDEVLRAMADWFTDQKMQLPERYRDAFSTDGNYEGPPLPVTARKLAAVRRISEASARAHLRDTIEMRDVELAKELVSRTLADLDIPIVENAGVGGGEITNRDDTELTGVQH